MNKENKEVVFVSISMTGGGTERVIATLANHMVSIGYKVMILLIAESEIAYDLNKRIVVKQVGETSGGSLVKRLQRISNMRHIFMEKGSYNIIAMGTVCSIFSGIANWGIKKNRLIVSERNIPNRINRKPYKWWNRMLRNLIYRTADILVLQTEASKDFFPKDIVRKSVIIGNPITSGLPEIYKGDRRKVIVSAGRLTTDKNYSLLLSAFKEFVEIHPDFTLEIYGSGELKDRLIDEIKNLQVENKVQIIPFTPLLHSKIQDASMFISSSDSEGISNSIMEALALGIPVIGTNCPIGGTAMLVKDGENGFLVPVGDRLSMVSAMGKIADDVKLAEKMSINAYNIREIYSENNICAKWISILK